MGAFTAQEKCCGRSGLFLTYVADGLFLTSKDKQDIKKPSGKNKATVGCIGNVLRPGKAIQVSIEDNKWVGEETLIIPEVKAVNQFLKELFNLP